LEDKQKIQVWIDKFPKKQGALIMALRIVQDRLGWLSDEVLDEVAQHLELEKIQVYEVASFYSMYRREERGKHQIKVCTSLSCCLAGAEDVIHYLEEVLGVSKDEVNAEGIALSETECLGACTQAPVVLLDDAVYIESVTPNVIDTLVDEIREKAVE
jgi:NADH-quinone oxidoreductase subunit E